MLLKVPIEGGVPVPVSDKYLGLPRLSPDGHWIAGFFQGAQNSTKIGVIPIDGGDLRWSFDIPAGVDWDSGIGWTPDGRELVYSIVVGTFRTFRPSHTPASQHTN